MAIIGECHCTAARKAARNIPSWLRSSAEWTSHRPQRKLAAALVMNRSTLGPSLRPLVREGLITMTASKDDARSKQISLSAREYARLVGRAAADHGRDVRNALAMHPQL
jgi:hypothetical protein